jgi:hypothetical protein
MYYISCGFFPNSEKYIYSMKDLYLGPVLTSKYGSTNSINWLNQLILKYTSSIYGPFGYSYMGGNKDINVSGRMINTEYIDKMVNNYTIFKAVIESQSINTEAGFYNYMVANMFDVYHYNGSHFDAITLPVLVATTRKGNKGERACLDRFKSELLSKNVTANILAPTLIEDGQGIDGKFSWNGRDITIQVKPYTSAVTDNGIVRAYSPGSLSVGIIGTGKNVDYLIIYKMSKDLVTQAEQIDMICARGKGVSVQGNCFVFSDSDIVFETR